MKKFKLIPVLCLLVMGLMVVPAQAEKTGVYAGLKFIDSIQTAWADNDEETRNTVGGAVFVGYDFMPKYDFPVRAELEYALRSNFIVSEGGSEYTQGNQTLLANFYFDFHNSTDFTPYVGAGLGMAFVNQNWSGGGASASNYSTNFAWQVGAGVAYAFNDTVSADLGYRFISFGVTEATLAGNKMNSYAASHEFALGLRFNF